METVYYFRELDAMFRNGKLKEAEQLLTAAMENVLRDNDLPALLALANELGGIFRVTGRLEEAKKIYNVALEIIKLLNLENTEQHGTTLLNMASVHTEADEPEEALRLDAQAETIFKNAGLDRDYRMAALYNNMSHVYGKLQRPEEALECARRSLAVIRELRGNDRELATSLTTLAAVCSGTGREEEAAGYLKEAEHIFRGLPGKPDVHYAAALNSLGEMSGRAGNPEEAAAYFEQALRILKENYGENKSWQTVAENLERVRKVTVVEGRTSGRTSGLELSEAYYNEYGRRMIEEGFSDYRRYMAVGLVGEGSECFGFDDELSESHDFGPGFCIWLPDEIDQNIGWKLKEAYGKLPAVYRNKRRAVSPEGGGRVGVFRIGEFYKKYTGCSGVPTNPVEWLFAPETSLATATNGKVFEDRLGEFTRIREGLLDFYPRDVLLKKLAARMAMMSQAGQYNYERCMKRNEYSAAYLSCSEFIRTAISAVYLLNGQYMPFYKWMFRGMDRLERLGDVKPMLEQLAAVPDRPENTGKKVMLIEDVCIRIGNELRSRGIIRDPEPFLNSHCRHVMSLIADEKIRSLPVMFDGK